MPDGSFEHKEIVRLLAKLKEETPDYPADLLEARKYAYLKQIVDLKISGEGTPGETKQQSKSGGQRGGKAGPGGLKGTGAALGSGATILGIPLKTALAIGAAILMLTAAYLFREQIAGFLAESGLIATEETAAPPLGSTPAGPAQETPNRTTTPAFGAPGAGEAATGAAPAPGDVGLAGTPTPPAQREPARFFQYLLCILRSGAEGCR